jgi:hypothetical protein
MPLCVIPINFEAFVVKNPTRLKHGFVDFNTKKISEEFHEEHKIGKGKGWGKG